MCGIAGIVALEGFNPEKLVAMTQMIRYRGPSGYGIAYGTLGRDSQFELHHNSKLFSTDFTPSIGLGNRRLAILDVSEAGNQPMEIENGALCITYNGEIYNYRELRLELEKLGKTFRTGTDTEVLLRSYQAWGEECLQRFNGMWSFALWDRAAHKLFCARDRFGVKPFYFTQTERAFYFSSEIKQVLMASGRSRRANLAVISEFLEWGLQDHLEETSFEGVYQLLGGHSLTIDLASHLKRTIRTYWELDVQPELKITPEEATLEFRVRFEDAIKLRLRSDVPVGISLSGGLDSSAVLCQAKKSYPERDFPSFSACFEDPAIDEREYISAIATATNSEKYWAFPDGESFWKVVEKIVYHQDEPIGGTSVFAQWRVMQEAQLQNVPVLLGGQGGDESLCGYRKYYFFHLWHMLRHADPQFIPEAWSFAINGSGSAWALATVNRYLPSVLRRRSSALDRVGTTELRNSSSSQAELVGAGRNLAERQRTDLLKSSLPKLLRHEDRNSMAHSIESRLPFLDYRLVEFAVRCPPSLKLHKGWSKWLLREALKGTLPDKVRLRRTKLGYNAPEANWLRSGLSNGHRSIWEKSKLRAARFLDPDSFTRECSRFLGGEAGALPAESLFRAVSLELWARVHEVS